MVTATLEAFAILLLVGIVGFIAVSRGLLPRDVLAPLSRVALEIALPALIFTNLITQDLSVAALPAWQLPLSWILFTVTATLLAFIASHLVPARIRAEFRAGLIYPNAVFVPLLLLSAKFGQTSPQIAMLFIFTLFFSPFYFTTYPLFFGQHTLSQVRWNRVFHPVLIMTLAALSIRFIGLQNAMPQSLIKATTMLGNAALPLILLVLGGQLTINAKDSNPKNPVPIVLFIAVKNIGFPLVFLVILILLRPPRLIALFIILQAAMPPITSLPIVARRANADHELTTRFLIGSFLAAIITIPLTIAVFDHFF